MGGQVGGGIDPTREDVHALHGLAFGPEVVHEIDGAVDPSATGGSPGGGIEAGERGHIIKCELVRIFETQSNWNAIVRVHVVHDGKSGVVIGSGGRISGDDIQI